MTHLKTESTSLSDITSVFILVRGQNNSSNVDIEPVEKTDTYENVDLCSSGSLRENPVEYDQVSEMCLETDGEESSSSEDGKSDESMVDLRYTNEVSHSEGSHKDSDERNDEIRQRNNRSNRNLIEGHENDSRNGASEDEMEGESNRRKSLHSHEGRFDEMTEVEKKQGTEGRKARTAVGKYQCFVCEYFTSEFTELKHHMWTHRDGPTYSCDFCPKMFKSKSGLQWHSKMHPNELTHKCSKCERRCVDSVTKSEHEMRCTHDNKCKICGITFRIENRMQFRSHLATHSMPTNFNCRYCGKTFKYKFALNQHVLVHLAEKSVKCPICTREFSRKSNLNEHLSHVHSTKWKFKCEKCEKSYKHNKDLIRHLKLHHS